MNGIIMAMIVVMVMMMNVGVKGSLQYVEITYYENNTKCADNQGITQVEYAGACFSLLNSYRYISCDGAKVTTYTDCDSTCSSCSTSHSVDQNTCVDNFIVNCVDTRPTYPSNRLVEVFYANQCSEYSAWTVFPSWCMSLISNSSMYYGCSNGAGYSVTCLDDHCQNNCVQSNLPMFQCSTSLPLSYQCGM